MNVRFYKAEIGRKIREILSWLYSRRDGIRSQQL